MSVSGGVTNTVKYYYAGSERVAMRQDGGAVKWLLGDHLGSTSLVFDGSQAIRQGYKAWGERRFILGGEELPTTFRYTGQREEASIGLYYYGARWYDTFLGRFTQADTIIPGTGNPQAWDRFSYSLNHALKYTDPSGHWICGNDNYDDTCAQNAQELLQRYAPQTKATGTSPNTTSSPGATKSNERDTVVDEAMKGNPWAIADLLLPTDYGVRLQVEIPINIPGIYIGITLTFGGNAIYNRNTDEAAGNADFTLEVGPGVGEGASLTVGPVFGWGSSNQNYVNSGNSLVISGTAAASQAVSVSVTTPIGADGESLYVDPKYGVYPVTFFIGGGAGAGYGSIGGGVVFPLTPSYDLSFLLPWN